jgi:hypothetical protein
MGTAKGNAARRSSPHAWQMLIGPANEAGNEDAKGARGTFGNISGGHQVVDERIEDSTVVAEEK